MLSIREVQISDAPRLVEIYSYYVMNTAVSFEYVVPTADEFERPFVVSEEVMSEDEL